MATATARRLRANLTEVEKRLWLRLRNRGLLGLKFRRQVPLGDFVVDFACADHGLIVELDGGQHGSSQARDDLRTAWLESRGWRVIRFWNNEVSENIDGVLHAVAGACGIDVDDPHPDPLPGGEGEIRRPFPEREGEGRAAPARRPRRLLSRGFAPPGSR